MKRIIAFMAVFALIFGLTFVPVKAEGTAWSLPFSKIETLIDIAQQLFSGAEVNLAEISNQALGLYDYILDYEYYINENGIYVPTLTLSQADALRIGLSSMALNGEDALTAISDLTIPIKASDIANFIGFSPDWIKRYNPYTSDVIVATPDENYINDMNYINTNLVNGGFYWQGYLDAHLGNVNQYSWCNYYNYRNQSMTANYNPYNLVRDITASSIFDVHLNGSGANWTITLSGYDSSVNTWDGQFHVFNTSNGAMTNRWIGNSSGILWSNQFTQTFTNFTLALNFVKDNFRNINLFVNDELWATAATAPADPFLQLGAVALGDLGTSTFPVYTLDQEGDLGLDVAAFADWLDSVIKSGATAISLKDAIADGIEIVDTETGERAVTEDDEEDVAKVIAGAQVTTAPSGSPTPTPDPDDDKKIPILKIIPPILDPVDEIWPDGGRDTTVLAQIIHSTDVIMPNDIMTILWSILGVMVIGGLLMILHK